MNGNERKRSSDYVKSSNNHGKHHGTLVSNAVELYELYPDDLDDEQHQQNSFSPSIVNEWKDNGLTAQDSSRSNNYGNERASDPEMNSDLKLSFVAQETGANALPILDQMRNTVRENSDKVFATWHGNNGQITNQHTFGKLWEEAGVISHHLRVERGLNKGDRVILCYNFGLSFFASFLGCLRGGVIAVLVYPPHPPFVKSLTKMNKVIEDCEAKLILTDSDIMFLKDIVSWRKAHRASRHLWPRDIEFKDTTKIKTKNRKGGLFALFKSSKARSELFDDKTICPQDLAFLQYTSGSTGDPKGVMVTLGALTANVNITIDLALKDLEARGGIPKEIVGCSWLPQYHDMGLILAIISPFAGGWRTHLMSPSSFINNPLLWLRVMSQYKVCWTVAPDFAYRLVTRKFIAAQGKNAANPVPHLNLSSLRYLQSAAEPIRPDTKTLFEATFSQYGLRDDWFLSGYGLAENVVFCCHLHEFHLSSQKSEKSETPTNIVAVGKDSIWASYQTIKIVDPLTKKELPEDETGELWLSGPSVAAGYFKKPELTKEVFHAKMIGSDKTFLRTGDLGFFQNGYLFICGRQKDLIIVNGVNYYPQDVEATVQDASNKVRPGCIAAFSSDDMGKDGDLEVVFEIRSASVHDVQQVTEVINLEIQQKIGLVPSRIVAIKERTIPKTTSGKIQRRATREALHSGKLKVIFDSASQDDSKHAYTEDPTKDTFDNVVAKYFGSNFDSEQTWEDMGMSSMTSVELRDSMSDKFAITLSPDCFEIYPTPSSLKSFTLNHTGTPLERKLPQLSPFKSIKLSWFMMGTMQAIGIIMLLLLFAFSIVPAWYTGKWLVRRELTSSSFQVRDGRWFQWVWTPLVVPTWMLSYSLSVICVKWLVVGKYKEGLMDVPSFAYLRWWFVDRAINLWEQWMGHYVKNTPLITLMYLLMGAKIHPSVKIDTFIREFDLVEIAKGGSVEHPIHCRKFGTWEGGQPGPTIRFRSIRIGENSVLQGMASPGASIGDNSCVNKHSVLEEGAQVPPESVVKGNPAFLTEEHTPPQNQQEEHCWWMLGIFKIVWLGFELYQFFAALLVGQILLNEHLPSDWDYTPLLHWFLMLPLISIFTIASSIILKWILIGRRKPGPLGNSLRRAAADWAAEYHYDIAMSLPLVTVLFNSRIWNVVLKMYGMDIDLHSQVYIADSFTPSNVDLIKIRNSLVSNVQFDVEKQNSWHHTALKECSIGWGVRVGAGVGIQRAIVSPTTHVTESIVQEEPDQRYNSCSSLSLFIHEIEVCLWCLLITLLIFASFIPAFEIWMSVFKTSSVWEAVPVLALDMAVQTLIWLVLVAMVNRLSTGFTAKRQMPWRTALYKVYLAINLAFQIWSLQSVLHGSPIFNWFIRLMGAKIESQALLFPLKVYDGPHLSIADKTVADRASLNGHHALFDKVTLGPCRVSGVLHEGTFAIANSVAPTKESGPWRVFAASKNHIKDDSKDVLDLLELSVVDHVGAGEEAKGSMVFK